MDEIRNCSSVIKDCTSVIVNNEILISKNNNDIFEIILEQISRYIKLDQEQISQIAERLTNEQQEIIKVCLKNTVEDSSSHVKDLLDGRSLQQYIIDHEQEIESAVDVYSVIITNCLNILKKLSMKDTNTKNDLHLSNIIIQCNEIMCDMAKTICNLCEDNIDDEEMKKKTIIDDIKSYNYVLDNYSNTIEILNSM
jgi:hypothetical protein